MQIVLPQMKLSIKQPKFLNRINLSTMIEVFNINQKNKEQLPKKTEKNRKSDRNGKSKEKRVSFNDTLSVRATLHVFDMTDEEVANAWYLYSEISQIRTQAALDASICNKTNATSTRNPIIQQGEEEHTCRGLECCTEKCIRDRRSYRNQSIYTVLDEQDAQYINGIFDPQAIREVYIEKSTMSLLAAQKMGKNDAIIAISIQNPPKKWNFCIS